MPASNIMLAGIQRNRRAQRYNVEEWFNLVPTPPPPAFDPTTFPADEPYQQASYVVVRDNADEWYAFLPSVPVVFDPQFMPQLEEVQIAFSRLLQDAADDVFPIILPPTVTDEPYVQPLFRAVWDEADTWYAFVPAAPVVFDPQTLPQEEGLQFASFPRIYDDTNDNVVQIFLPPFDAEDARVVGVPPPQADLPWDVLPIFLPPFVVELQPEPKTKRDYMWLDPVTLDDWLQPPAVQIVNTTANGRSTRLGLVFPAMR